MNLGFPPRREPVLALSPSLALMEEAGKALQETHLMDEETEAQGGEKVPLPKVNHWRCLDPCPGLFVHAAFFDGECFRALNSDMLLAPGPPGRFWSPARPRSARSYPNCPYAAGAGNQRKCSSLVPWEGQFWGTAHILAAKALVGLSQLITAVTSSIAYLIWVFLSPLLFSPHSLIPQTTPK